MTDPKPTETEAQRAERIKRTEDAVKKVKTVPGIVPQSPEEAARVEELARQRDEAQRRHERDFPGLKIPPKTPRGR